MAWNEPGSSNNDNKDKKDPWSGKPKNVTPPDLEQILRNTYKKIVAMLTQKSAGNNGKISLPPAKINGLGLALITLALFIAWLLWGIFIIDPAEQAVILRFGKYVNTLGPGPHWIPRIIDTPYVVNEQKISTFSYAAEMLTKDQNIVSVAIAVQYRIVNANDYLFKTSNPEESLKQATASALRQVIGRTNLNQVLTSGREQIRQEVAMQLASVLAKYQTGLLVTDVAMQPAKAPDEVKDAFDDAIKAQEDEQRFENQAQAYAMQVAPAAHGQAQRLLADANAYKQQVVLHAQADTAQFLALLPQYKRSPNVMRERMYLATLENVFENTNKVLIDSHGNNNMFYLPLAKLFNMQLSSKPAPIITPPLAPPSTPSPATPATTATPTASSTTAPNAYSASSANPDEGNARLQGGY